MDYNDIHDNKHVWTIKISEAIATKHSGIMRRMERDMEHFINQHYEELVRHEAIEDYLDIRDALLIHIARQILNEQKTKRKCEHSLFQCMFQEQIKPELRPTFHQIKIGYIPCEIGGPIKYKCGCSALHYHNPQEPNSDILTRFYYCKYHHKIKNIEAQLSSTLEVVQRELESITHTQNRIM